MRRELGGGESRSLLLLGGQRALAADAETAAVVQFYGELFGRLEREVGPCGRLRRHVAYQNFLGGKEYLHFLGAEVCRIETIPTGMVVWELSENCRRVWESGEGGNSLVSQEDIAWVWSSDSPFTAHSLVGEFTTRGGGKYWMSANSYSSGRETEADFDESPRLLEYDPAWPREFVEMAAWLRQTLGSDVALRVEHYGSTAIEGMPAKPIIDILVEVPSFLEAKRQALPLLNRPEWEYWWHSGHMLFLKRRGLMGERTHHVHLAPKGHDVWRGLAFRDHLRSHADYALQYAAMKRELALAHRHSREGYTDAKREFVLEVTAKGAVGTGRRPRNVPAGGRRLGSVVPRHLRRGIPAPVLPLLPQPFAEPRRTGGRAVRDEQISHQPGDLVRGDDDVVEE